MNALNGKWRTVKYVHPTENNQRGIRKIDKYFAREHDFTDIKFPVKIKIFAKSKKKSCVKKCFQRRC